MAGCEALQAVPGGRAERRAAPPASLPGCLKTHYVQTRLTTTTQPSPTTILIPVRSTSQPGTAARVPKGKSTTPALTLNEKVFHPAPIANETPPSKLSLQNDEPRGTPRPNHRRRSTRFKKLWRQRQPLREGLGKTGSRTQRGTIAARLTQGRRRVCDD